MRRAILLATALLAAGSAGADDAMRSGATYLPPATQAMQDEDAANPGMLWVTAGERLFATFEGQAGRSCQSCHGPVESGLQDVAATYPKVDPATKTLKNLQAQIAVCRKDRMQATPWSYESEQMVAVTAYLRYQVRGQRMRVSIDGPAIPFFQAGEAAFNRRQGTLNLACKNCHVDSAGKRARDVTLSQGQTNGFPAYGLGSERVGSAHRRFRACNLLVGAAPRPYGDPEYVNLELYLAWRGRDLRIETPAVRD